MVGISDTALNTGEICKWGNRYSKEWRLRKRYIKWQMIGTKIKQHYSKSHIGIKVHWVKAVLGIKGVTILVLIVPKESCECWEKRRVLILRPSLYSHWRLEREILTFVSFQKNICSRFLYVIWEVHGPCEAIFKHFKLLNKNYPKYLHSRMY